MPGTAGAQNDGDWPLPGKNLAGFRYSELDQINTGNVGQLEVSWTFSVGVLRGQEAAPIVAEDTMFVVTPYPNILYALDLTRPGAPLKWKHEPKPLAAAQGVACCDVVNRAPPTPRAGCSSTLSAGRRSASRPRPAKSCGAPGSATSISARP